MADNRRVRMTKKLIKDAYLELLESNPSEKISVTDVCKVADVNRSTFYMYYEDTIALRHDIENDVMDQIPVLSDMPSEITTDKQFVDILERFFSYLEENSRMFRILILNQDAAIRQPGVQPQADRRGAGKVPHPVQSQQRTARQV